MLPFLLKAQDTIMGGKCYTQAWEKDEYKTVTEQVLVKEHGCHRIRYILPPEKKDTIITVKKAKPITGKSDLASGGTEYKTVKQVEIRTLTRKVPPQIEEEDKPAEYATVTKTVLVKKGKKIWVEVSCQKETELPIVLRLRAALQAKGYDTGPLEDCWGQGLLRAALTKFQQDNNLPVGRLDAQTMQALGLEKTSSNP